MPLIFWIDITTMITIDGFLMIIEELALYHQCYTSYPGLPFKLDGRHQDYNHWLKEGANCGSCK